MKTECSRALGELVEGNLRALRLGRALPQQGERLPTAAVLACTDERVVPQVIFDHPPGKIYTVRMAGNVYSAEVAGSLELAVLRLGCPLILVLGHTDCTAVAMARSRERVGGAVYDITRKIGHAVAHLPPEAPLVQAVEANVRATLRDLRERSRALREREAAGELEIEGALYELETGAVRLLY
jgi:carbonic anhydrase